MAKCEEIRAIIRLVLVLMKNKIAKQINEKIIMMKKFMIFINHVVIH